MSTGVSQLEIFSHECSFIELELGGTYSLAKYKRAVLTKFSHAIFVALWSDYTLPEVRVVSVDFHFGIYFIWKINRCLNYILNVCII